MRKFPENKYMQNICLNGIIKTNMKKGENYYKWRQEMQTISYKKHWKLLIDKEMLKKDFCDVCDIMEMVESNSNTEGEN